MRNHGHNQLSERKMNMPIYILSEGMIQSNFRLGKVLCTAGANAELDMVSVLNTLHNRYMKCDWGDLSDKVKKLNVEALKDGGEIFASYKDANGRKFYIITEADRSVTTILLPEER